MFQTIGLNGAITIVSHFVFIMLAFRALNALRFEQFIKANHVREAQVLLLFIAVALGFLVKFIKEPQFNQRSQKRQFLVILRKTCDKIFNA